MLQDRRDEGECIMPYKPNWNVVRADINDCRTDVEGQSVESSEMGLPDDLQAVADQLTDDAHHLQSQFPARLAPPAPALLAKSSRTPPWRRAAAAVLLIGVGAGAVIVAQHLASSRDSAVVNSPLNRRAPLATETLDQSTPPNPVSVQEVSFDRTAPRAKLTEVEMLRIQLDAFEKVIRRLQDELADRQKSEAQTKQFVDLLRHEIDDLRRQLEDGDHAPAK
jgi:hypothetical protein